MREVHSHGRLFHQDWKRGIVEPVLRLVSVDLKSQADVKSLAEVFDYAKDYLGLLKAAVIASGTCRGES